jgi:AraC family transcriptional activator of pobA
MKSVPTYSLYGVTAEERLAERVHCESIAERSRLHSWEIKPHRHEHFFQLLYIRSGTVQVQLDDHRLRLDGGHILTVPPRSIHGFEFSEDVDGAVITLTESYCRLLVSAAPEARPALNLARVLAVSSDVTGASAAAALVDLFVAEFNIAAPMRSAALSALLSLVLIALARGAAVEATQGSVKGGRVTRRFLRFKQLVEAGYRARHDLGAYAADVGVTKTQLNRVCREMSNLSALQVLNERIVVEAQRNLLYTDLDIKQIASTLGFADASYFTRFFAKQVGQTPTEFRAMARTELR